MQQGLEFLSHSIDQKSASLKVLVESNFERFVRAKTTIDNVYAEMRNQGVEPEKPKTHARIPSKGSAHYRSSSGQGALSPNKGIHKPLPSDKKKNALTKESEYGVQGIKAPLIEVAIKVEELWGPALGGRDKEGMLKMVVESLEKNRGIFETSAELADSIKRKDYEKLVENYSQARKYADEARDVVNTATEGQIPLTDAQIHQIVITARMWEEVEKRVDNFKRTVWRKLTDSTPSSMAAMGGSQYEEYTALIAILLELGVEDNPIWLWLLSRWEYLKNKINASFERSRVQIEVLRRHLANSETPTLKIIASHLRPSTPKSLEEKAKDLDTVPILELWELIFSSIHNLLSSQSGILGEVIEFWDRAQKFIDGKVQKTLPVGFDGRSRIHHRLSTESIRQLQDGIFGLVDLLREHVFSFFADPPIEDISMLYSPLPPQTPNTPKSATRSPFGFHDSRFMFDNNNLPPPSPRRGEAWEEFAFWPPHASSLSGTHYLGKILALIGAAAGEMLGIRQVASGGLNLLEKLRTLISGVRERSTRAVCIAWNRDAEACKVLEDWKRSPERRDLTAMPGHFSSFEAAVLSGMQKILYIPDAGTTRPPGSTGVVPPPPAKLLLVVRSQFVTTLYNAISGMVENAERPVSNSNPDWVMTGSKFDHDFTAAVNGAEGALDVKNRVCSIFISFSNQTTNNISLTPLLLLSGHSHAPYPQQPQSSSKRNRPSSHLPIRNILLRQTNRRIQLHPRRPGPNRGQTLLLIHFSHSRSPLPPHPQRGPTTPQKHHIPPTKHPPLCPQSPPHPSPHPHPSNINLTALDYPYPNPSLRIPLSIFPVRLSHPSPLFFTFPYAEYTRYRIRGAGDEPVHYRTRYKGPGSDPCGAG